MEPVVNISEKFFAFRVERFSAVAQKVYRTNMDFSCLKNASNGDFSYLVNKNISGDRE